MHFGTAKAVRSEALEDLERAPGVSAAVARTCEGRRVSANGNAANLSDTGAGAKLARMTAGPSRAPNRGDTVSAMTSPTTGIAGRDVGSTSGRAVP